MTQRLMDRAAHHFLRWVLKGNAEGHSWLCPSCQA